MVEFILGNMKNIYLITDCVDIAAVEMKAVIRSQVKSSNITIDIAPVAPLSIINGSFILRLMAEVASPGSILSVVLNPLKE